MIRKLIEAIKAFGFGSLQLDVKDFMVAENIIQLGYEPHRIDLLVDVAGIDFEECFKRRTAAKLDGVKVNFLSCQDLIATKKKSERLQDLADAEQLEKIEKKNKEKLD